MKTIYFFAIFSLVLPMQSFAKDFSCAEKKNIEKDIDQRLDERAKYLELLQALHDKNASLHSVYAEELKEFDSLKEKLNPLHDEITKEAEEKIASSEEEDKLPAVRHQETGMFLEESLSHRKEYIKIVDAQNARITEEYLPAVESAQKKHMNLSSRAEALNSQAAEYEKVYEKFSENEVVIYANYKKLEECRAAAIQKAIEDSEAEYKRNTASAE